MEYFIQVKRTSKFDMIIFKPLFVIYRIKKVKFELNLVFGSQPHIKVTDTNNGKRKVKLMRTKMVIVEVIMKIKRIHQLINLKHRYTLIGHDIMKMLKKNKNEVN